MKKGGDAQDYRITLKAGEYCAITITQSAIDLAGSLSTAQTGGRMADVEYASPTTGDEVVEIIAERSGAYIVTISAVEPDAEQGSARIHICATIRRSSDDDGRRVSALRILEGAEQLRAKGLADPLRASSPS